MSLRSFRVSRPKAGATFVAELTFPDGGKSSFDTKLTDKAAAEKLARYRLRQRIAHQRHHKREKLIRQGKEIPAELRPLRPGRRTKVAAAAAAPPAPARKRGRPPKVRPIDHGAVAQRLQQLQQQKFPNPTPPAAPDPEETPTPEPTEGSEGPHPIPPLPSEPPPAAPPAGDEAPIEPEVLDGAADQAGQQIFAEVIAIGAVTAFVKGVSRACENWDPPMDPAPPHEGSLRWMQEGLSVKIAQFMGNRTIGPVAKILVGAAGVALSMVMGATPKAGNPAAASPSSQQQPAPPAPPPQGEHDPEDMPTARAPQFAERGLQTTNGHAAVGRFR